MKNKAQKEYEKEIQNVLNSILVKEENGEQKLTPTGSLVVCLTALGLLECLSLLFKKGDK